MTSSTKRFAILSVPHTGTNFVCHLLGGPKKLEVKDMDSLHTEGPHDLFLAHTYRMSCYQYAYEHGFEIVVPMRHPVKTCESWMNWRLKADEKHHDQWWMQEDVPLKLFKTLITMDQLFDISYLPIDGPYKREYLDCFNKKHGLNLKTKWRKRNSIGKYVTTLPDGLREEAEKFIQDNSEFFCRFY
jgi:hypothetical protein